MIKKEFSEVKTTDKFSQAGNNAEKRMAFYLKRDFGDDPQVFVLNSIRLEWNDDSAQMDHLVIHKYGMIIIESKSVTTKVVINERREWSRYYNDSLKGMPSPIEQAKRQATFLRKYLDTCGPKLPSDFGIQRKFGKLPIDVIVAISDSGIIKPAEGLNLDNVCKADVVPGRVCEIIKDYDRKKGSLSLSFRPFTLSNDSREDICTCLIQAHTPLEKVPDKSMEPKSPVTVERQQTKECSFRCGKCQGKNIEIRYGRSYYIKCRECDGNTPIKQICQSCKGIMRIRKNRNEFFAECQACKTSNHIFTNPG